MSQINDVGKTEMSSVSDYAEKIDRLLVCSLYKIVLDDNIARYTEEYFVHKTETNLEVSLTVYK